MWYGGAAYIDDISARESVMVKKNAKLIKYMTMVPPVLPSSSADVELLYRISR